MVPLNCSQCICGSVDDADRCKSNRNSSFLLQLGALLHHSKHTILPITLFQYTYRHASPPSLVTQKRGEKQSPHKKSRWEYIIWSEKQFVLVISCLCAKVIPPE
ncbi:hypothetical protein XENOCAPTIV_004997 [Xenoophorus captivus]|uniref:Uncharacterized protein n=1 Tax=Xenoophorus captivus TaxID=1517983 RepID=A0ABV0R3R1_9TELE